MSLEATLPALLRGELEPVDAEQQAAYAALCYYKSFHAAATRLYAEAFAAEPALARDVDAGHSSRGACAAACRQLRAQALQWLRLNLALRADQLPKNPAKNRLGVIQKLSFWFRDPDLTSLRGADAIARLPEPEREACRRFWADAEALRCLAPPAR